MHENRYLDADRGYRPRRAPSTAEHHHQGTDLQHNKSTHQQRAAFRGLEQSNVVRIVRDIVVRWIPRQVVGDADADDWILGENLPGIGDVAAAKIVVVGGARRVARILDCSAAGKAK